MNSCLDGLPTWDKDGHLQVIVETPMGCRNKYSFDPELGLFRLKKALPKGLAFPFDFGFLPSTRADDGDPLDVLLITEEPAYPGVLIVAHLLGVIQAEQIENGKSERNDRLVAAAILGKGNSPEELPKLDEALMKQVEQFFVSYNRLEGKEFKILEGRGPKKARKLIEAGERRFKKGTKPAK